MLGIKGIKGGIAGMEGMKGIDGIGIIIGTKKNLYSYGNYCYLYNPSKKRKRFDN